MWRIQGFGVPVSSSLTYKTRRPYILLHIHMNPILQQVLLRFHNSAEGIWLHQPLQVIYLRTRLITCSITMSNGIYPTNQVIVLKIYLLGVSLPASDDYIIYRYLENGARTHVTRCQHSPPMDQNVGKIYVRAQASRTHSSFLM